MMWSDSERLCLHASAGAQGKKNNTPEQARRSHLRRGSQQKVRVPRQERWIGQFGAPEADVFVTNQEKCHEF